MSIQKPRTGDKVYDTRRVKPGCQPNGKIIGIISYDEPRELMVKFEPDETFPKGELCFFYEEEFDTFNVTRNGGYWELGDEGIVIHKGVSDGTTGEAGSSDKEST